MAGRGVAFRWVFDLINTIEKNYTKYSFRLLTTIA